MCVPVCVDGSYRMAYQLLLLDFFKESEPVHLDKHLKLFTHILLIWKLCHLREATRGVSKLRKDPRTQPWHRFSIFTALEISDN